MAQTLNLDKASILESMGGDEELFIDMARMYIDESDSYYRNVQKAVSSKDIEALRREAHTLKSLFATFADEDGRQLAIKVEQQAKTGIIDSEFSSMLEERIRLLAEVLRQETA